MLEVLAWIMIGAAILIVVGPQILKALHILPYEKMVRFYEKIGAITRRS